MTDGFALDWATEMDPGPREGSDGSNGGGKCLIRVGGGIRSRINNAFNEYDHFEILTRLSPVLHLHIHPRNRLVDSLLDLGGPNNRLRGLGRTGS